MLDVEHRRHCSVSKGISCWDSKGRTAESKTHATSSPRIGQGTGTTATSLTASCWKIAFSTETDAMFSPDRMICH